MRTTGRPAAIAAIVPALLLLPLAATAAHAQPDHPDDCADAATIDVGGPAVRAVIDPTTDQDWFGFEAQAGRLYYVLLSEMSADFWTSITVAGPGCATPIISEPANHAWIAADQAGPYRIGISSASGAGLYSITVTDDGPNPDQHPAATPVPLPADGAVAHGAIDFIRDVDVFAVTLAPGTVYRLDVTDVGCGSVQAALLGPDGEGVGATAFSSSSRDHHTGDCREGFEYAATYYVPAAEGGEYQVWVTNYSDTTSYTLSVTPIESAPAGDDHAAGCDDATPIVVGAEPVRVVLDPVDDVDALTLEAQAGRFYRVRFTTEYPSQWVDVVGPGCDSPVPTPTHGPLSFVAAQSGPHTLLFRAIIPMILDVRIDDLGPVTDDHGNGRPGATDAEADGAAIAAAIDYAWDTDVFRLPLAPGGLYEVELTATGCAGVRALIDAAGPGPAHTLFAYPSGGCAPQSDTASFFVASPDDPEFYVEVLGDAPATYTLRVSTLALLDPGADAPDACADAAAIAPGEPPVFSALDGAGDQDWFAFEAQAGHLYRVSLDDLDRNAPGITLFSPDCAEPVAVPALGTPVQTFLARAEGPHRVRVAPRQGGLSDRGPYLLGVDHLGPGADDHADTTAAATRMSTDGAPIAGAADFEGDADVFRAYLRPRTSYRIALQSPTCAGIGATVVAPDAQRSAAALWTGPDVGPCDSPNRAESIFYVPSTEPGDHFIVVRGDAGPGAAPYLLSIEPTGCLADFDHSGAVNSADISAFLAAWLAAVALPHPENLAADFSGDGATNSSDIAAFLQSWLAGLSNGGDC